MIVNGEKLACETCIRGHRVAQCQHTDRPLQQVSSKGRPVSQCDHCRSLRNSRSVHTRCKCGLAARNPTKQPAKDQCQCCHGEACTCATKKKRPAATSTRKILSKDPAISPSPSTDSGGGGCCSQLQSPGVSSTPSIADITSVVSADSVSGLNTWSPDAPPTEDLVLAANDDLSYIPAAGDHDWMTNLDSMLGMDNTQILDTSSLPIFDHQFPEMGYSLGALFDQASDVQHTLNTDAFTIPLDWQNEQFTALVPNEQAREEAIFGALDPELPADANFAWPSTAKVTPTTAQREQNAHASTL